MARTFGRASRLREHAAFMVVQKTGRRVSTPFVTLLGKPNGLGGDRLGVVASRRLGGAVVRNRAKRRLREMFRNRPAPDAGSRSSTPWDVVVIPRRSVIDSPFAVVEADFRAALRRLRG